MNGRGHGESCNFRNAVISASPLDIFQAVNDKKCKDCRREGLSQKIDIAGKTASWFEDEEGEETCQDRCSCADGYNKDGIMKELLPKK